jgi:7-carboxy-7-deazaguanine synthase
MSFDGLLVTEIFHSIQGETSLMGIPFIFIRLTGCNLRCSYCDSSYSFKGGQRLRISEIKEKIAPWNTQHVLITGGEPLLQRKTPALVQALIDQNYAVSIETHGEISIASVVKQARIVLDIKTPSSGMCRGGYTSNLPLLKSTDEVKFVIASPEDYLWAKSIVLSKVIPTQEILFSPALPAAQCPGSFPGVEPKWLAERILEDGLPVRFQLQIHKYLWGLNSQGV